VRAREEAGRGHRRDGQRRDRDQADDEPDADVRPPPGRRRVRGDVPARPARPPRGLGGVQLLAAGKRVAGARAGESGAALRASMAVVATTALAASAAPATVHPARTAATGTVKVSFAIDKFVKKGNGLAASGRATAVYTDTNGEMQTTTKPFTVKVVGHGIRGL